MCQICPQYVSREDLSPYRQDYFSCSEDEKIEAQRSKMISIPQFDKAIINFMAFFCEIQNK